MNQTAMIRTLLAMREQIEAMLALLAAERPRKPDEPAMRAVPSGMEEEKQREHEAPPTRVRYLGDTPTPES